MRSVPFFLVFFAAVPARADDLRYLDHADVALSALYDDIENATSSIDLTYFIWDPCSSAAKVLTKALQEKARPKPTAANPHPKPVKVRLMIDGALMSDYGAPLEEYLAQSGIELKVFNPDFPLANNHSHSKVAVFDAGVPGREKLLTGGRNIADEYFGMAASNYVDRDVEVTPAPGAGAESDTALQAANAYKRLWSNPRSMHPGRASGEKTAKFRACSRWNAKDASLEKFLKRNSSRLASGIKPTTCGHVKFTMDDMSQIGKFGTDRARVKPTSGAVLELVQGAQRTLTMENQYFIPDDTYMKGWIDYLKAKRHVKIDVYSNMFDRGDKLDTIFDPKNADIVTFWQQQEMRAESGGGETNHMNFRIAGLMDRWQFTPKGADYRYHAKDFVADGKNALVGSFNIDPRSMFLNGESAVSVRNCPAFARNVETVARNTGKVWDLEERLHICMTGQTPRPGTPDPLTGLIELFSKDLQ